MTLDRARARGGEGRRKKKTGPPTQVQPNSCRSKNESIQMVIIHKEASIVGFKLDYDGQADHSAESRKHEIEGVK